MFYIYQSRYEPRVECAEFDTTGNLRPYCEIPGDVKERVRKEGGEGIVPWTSCGFQRGDLGFDHRVEQPINPAVSPPPPSNLILSSRSVFCKGNLDTPLRAFPLYSLFKPLPQLTDNGPNCGLFTSES